MVTSLAPTFDGKRTIPSGEITALMLDLLQLKPGDKVLEIGTGSGSQTKALAATGAEIHSVELEPFIDSVNMDGCTNIYLHTGDGKFGLEAEAPFDAIMATCGVEHVPEAWVEQLDEQGELVAPVGDPMCQRLTLFAKVNGALIPLRVAAYVKFQMLRDKPKPVKVKYHGEGQ